MKYGLNGRTIKFTPKCKHPVSKNDVIKNDSLKFRLYCVGENEFVIITDRPSFSFLTEKDLQLEFENLTYK